MMREKVKKVNVDEKLVSYAVNIVDASRKLAEIAVGASPRALLSLLRCAQALAYMDGRDYCIPEDIANSAVITLPHRFILTTEARLSSVTKEDLVKKILQKVIVP